MNVDICIRMYNKIFCFWYDQYSNKVEQIFQIEIKEY